GVERQERFAEAIEIIQGLLAGELTNYRGRYFQLDHARLFDRPNSKPPVAIAAGGIEAARLAGRKGDALVATEARSDLVKAFISAGGSGPHYAEVALCYAEHVEAARKTAHRYFRWSVTGWPVMAELPDTEDSRRRASTSRPRPSPHSSAAGHRRSIICKRSSAMSRRATITLSWCRSDRSKMGSSNFSSASSPPRSPIARPHRRPARAFSMRHARAFSVMPTRGAGIHVLFSSRKKRRRWPSR